MRLRHGTRSGAAAGAGAGAASAAALACLLFRLAVAFRVFQNACRVDSFSISSLRDSRFSSASLSLGGRGAFAWKRLGQLPAPPPPTHAPAPPPSNIKLTACPSPLCSWRSC
jgi:hypothetical protein